MFCVTLTIRATRIVLEKLIIFDLTIEYFVLRFACAEVILRSIQPAVLILESTSFFSLGRCKTSGEQNTNKTLHLRCQTALPNQFYLEGIC